MYIQPNYWPSYPSGRWVWVPDPPYYGPYQPYPQDPRVWYSTNEQPLATFDPGTTTEVKA